MAHSETEQLMIELINRARLDPQGEAARAGLGLSRRIGKDPAFIRGLFQRGEHDVSNATEALAPEGITCPRLAPRS